MAPIPATFETSPSNERHFKPFRSPESSFIEASAVLRADASFPYARFGRRQDGAPSGRRILLALALALQGPLVPAGAAEQTVADAPAQIAPAPLDPVGRNVEGWCVHIDPALVHGKHSKQGELALKMLANHLQRIKIVAPAAALAKLQNVEIWIERDHPRLKGMQYHPSKDWLIEHGHDPRLTRKVHIPQAAQLLSREQMLKHPAVVLHELAHGYHDQVLDFDNPQVIEAFEAAKQKGLYQDVLLHTGANVRHYGLTNHKEYFAEGTEAFFYRNDFYPFVRAELQQYDPALHELLGRLWKVDDAAED